MATRSLRWRDWGVSVSVPPRVASRLRRRGPGGPRFPGGNGQSGAPRTTSTGGLTFLDPPPLDLRQRDVDRAIEFVGIAAEKGDEHAEQTGWTGTDDLTSKVRSIAWYHTIELPDGSVTPGQFDHRELVPHYGLPDSLAGKTALDVATFDGFWAFQLEQRGGDVTAIDLDSTRDLDFPHLVRPAIDATPQMPVIGEGFRLAHEMLGSSVKRVSSSVYALDPAKHGTFDFVHCGDLLLHLRDPLTALEHIRSVTAGQFLLSDVVDIDTSRGRFGRVVQYLGGWEDVVWWVPSLDALAQMVVDAGFRDVRVNRVYQLAKTYDEAGFWRASLTATV